MSSRLRPVLAAVVVVLVTACGGLETGGGTPSPSKVDVGKGGLTGAGASFPEPFYTKAFYTYHQKYPQVDVNYQPVGSGGGIKAFTEGTVDFGASDVPMNDREIADAGGADTMVQIPSTLGVVSMAYNLPGVDKLQLDGPTIANIFLGKVRRWDDASIKAQNSGVNLPAKDIAVVKRSDGSGTTYCFSDYLSKVSDEWKTKYGAGKTAVQWPVGVGAKGNEGVANGVKTTDGAISYVELAYVLQSKMQQAHVKNKAGKYLQASTDGATAAAAQATGISATNFSIVDQPGDASYPITTFSWIMLRKAQKDQEKGRAVVYLFKWLVSDGQPIGKGLSYAPLPSAVSQLANDALAQVTYSGKPILTK
jgi:phosphate transport system substrate-binding protein